MLHCGIHQDMRFLGKQKAVKKRQEKSIKWGLSLQVISPSSLFLAETLHMTIPILVQRVVSCYHFISPVEMSTTKVKSTPDQNQTSKYNFFWCTIMGPVPHPLTPWRQTPKWPQDHPKWIKKKKRKKPLSKEDWVMRISYHSLVFPPLFSFFFLFFAPMFSLILFFPCLSKLICTLRLQQGTISFCHSKDNLREWAYPFQMDILVLHTHIFISVEQPTLQNHTQFFSIPWSNHPASLTNNKIHHHASSLHGFTHSLMPTEMQSLAD